MAWTTAERDALKTAIAKGEKEVAFADRRVTYRSLDEMVTALAMIETELAESTTPARPRQYGAYSSKGL